MRHLEIHCGPVRIALQDLDLRVSQPAGQKTDRPTVHLGAMSPNTALEVKATDDAGPLWRLVLSADGGPSTVHPAMALCQRGQMLLGIGPYVVCLDVLTGQLKWSQQADDVTVFAIHPLPSQDALLIHGELEITKLALDGSIQWQAAGRDIFTGEVTSHNDHVEVTDFNGDIYDIRLDTGECRIVGHGKCHWDR